MGAAAGKPIADVAHFVAELKAHAGIGELPPIILAALRKRMVALAGEIGDGVVFRQRRPLPHARLPGGHCR